MLTICFSHSMVVVGLVVEAVEVEFVIMVEKINPPMAGLRTMRTAVMETRNLNMNPNILLLPLTHFTQGARAKTYIK